MKRDDFEITNNNEIAYGELDGLREYYKEIDKKELLSQEEELDLARKIKDGDLAAKEKFIECNLRLVRYVASKYINSDISMDELIQEGNLALLRAVESFNPNMGNRFSTYAIPCIKSGIRQATINNKSVIKQSVYSLNKIVKYNECIEKLAQKLHRMPSKYEIADELGVSISDVDKINLMMQKTVSLDSFVSDSEDTELSELIANPNIDVENEVILKLLSEDIQKRIMEKDITKNEMMVIYYTCGFDGNGHRTQAEISEILNLSRVRINQLLSSALNKLNISYAEVNKNVETNTLENIDVDYPKYKFDYKTKKLLKKVQSMMSDEEYKELEETIINVRQDSKFDSIGNTELIISLLSFGFIGNKHYSPIEIATILCLDYNSIKPVINGILDRYNDTFTEYNGKSLIKKR